MKIIITGGTGALGTQLVYELIHKGHEVGVVTRQSPSQLGPQPFRIIQWPIQTEEEKQPLLNCDALINLAGESIAGGRWTDTRKEKIRHSRVNFTSEIVDHLRSSTKLRVFLSSSAIGFYGHRKSELLTEDSPTGEGFLANICKNWELSALQLKTPGVRTVLLRTGIVLDRNSGIIKELEPLNHMCAGGTVGSGEQFMSWIHMRDWVNAVIHCLESDELSGPVNIVAPQAVTNKSFTKLYGGLFNKPMQMAAPAFALKAALGEMSALALDSQNVRPERLEKTGFKFDFPYLKEALEDIYEYESQGREVFDFFADETWINKPVEMVFEFFSDAHNLEKITPPLLNFKVINISTSEIMTGTLIDYQLKIHGIPVKWQTKIDGWKPPHKFIDTQLRGPYKLWHHTHTFEKLGQGTLMKDRVHYKLPLGTLGRIGGISFVKNDVSKIFSYRKQVIQKYFT